jgi:hypothetical protein
MKICIIVAYFGPWPTTFGMFIKSARCNPDVDFLFVTDNTPDAGTPANVRYVNTTLSALRNQFMATLNAPVSLSRPYDLCDLKPMYGVTFADYLVGYDFWGYCDIDLVFGNIRHFLTDAVLEQNDKIFMQGHFSLYRNNAWGNSLYRLREDVVDWREIVSKSINRGFDEWNGIFKIMQAEGLDYFRKDEAIADIVVDSYNLTTTETQHIYPQVYYHENGQVFRESAQGKEELLYVHLQKRRLEPATADVLRADRIYFTPTGFVAGPRTLTPKAMLAINGNRLVGSAEFLRRRVVRKLKNELARLLPA